MDKTITKAVSFGEQKADEYRYWQSVPASERMRCGFELSKEACRRKGLYKDGQELDRTSVSLRSLRSAQVKSKLARGRLQDFADAEILHAVQTATPSNHVSNTL